MAGSYTYTGTAQTVTVQTTGVYHVVVDGGQGGTGALGGSGGEGSEISADLQLTAGEVLTIVVGQAGRDGSGQDGGSGGGGSFIIETFDGTSTVRIPLVIAGGGGGGYSGSGGAGNAGTAGSNGYGQGGGGGTAGNGGDHGAYYGGGGGGGFLTSGGSVGYYGGGNGGGGGPGNYAGGAYRGGPQGGFGGGGGAGYGGGGGGGGYSGGGGGYGGGRRSGVDNGGGGGGGSYNSGSNQVETAGVHTGDGLVTISPSPACYLRGTHILTATGEVAVEALAIGDVLVTASGAQRPIKWIGTRSYAGRFANANPSVLPICFKAGSLGDNTPRRDLWVSPKHAMFLDGVLIQSEALVNGASVVRADQVDVVDYFHIELDSHDVIVADGALSETFVEDGGRGIFHNAHEFGVLYPDAEPVEAIYCAPRVEGGFALEAVRRRIAERAGLPVPSDAALGALRGSVERIDGARITGWAQSEGHPDVPVCLDVMVDGVVVAQVLAGSFDDELPAGMSDGGSFEVRLSTPTSGRVAVRRSADHAVLPVAQAA